jgi:DNA gyrase subunit A
MEEVSNNVKAITIEEEMRNAFLSYSMSVIVQRALPDVRDGLKPVQRRILFAMHGLKNFHNRPYLKSARVVGDVIGRYHPHGDSAVYEALVRMAQEFSLRYPLVDGQGNFGSIDGDAAAAMRYTECRLEEVAEFLLSDIQKETVDFGPNYDNKEEEPLVMPARIPQLLVNGVAGIAVGMATNIPPHNLGEVLDGLDMLIDRPESTIMDLMSVVKGPDFPTGGTICGMKGIKDAFETGRGSIVMRAKTNVEPVPKSSGREQIIVTELPYQVNKARLIERIAELVRDKKLEGISDLRDESAQDEIRVVIELKKGEIPDVVLNNLYKHTPLQTTFGVNTVALNRGAPKIMNLKQMLEAFLAHRREVVLRRTAFELRKAEERGHILLGLKTAVEHIDEVVALIRGAKDSDIAQAELISRFALSEIQAKAILELRLSRLTGLERDKIVAEYEETVKLIEDLKDILEKPARVIAIIREELREIREKFSDERRTDIVADMSDEFSMESLIANEEVAVTVTHAGYVKRTPLTAFRAQRRGGKGKTGMETREEDIVRDLFMATNHQSLLLFSNLGKVYDIKVYEIPEAVLRSKGKHLANLVKLAENEKIVSILPVKEFVEGKYVVSVTAQGYIKKTDLMAYSNLRTTGIIGLKLEDDDSLITCAITNGNEEIIVVTSQGKAIRFNEEEIRPMGRASRGVTAIRFSEEGDRVIGMEIIRGDSTILSVCVKGYGKRTPLEEYRSQSRGGKGIYTIQVTERNGPVIGVLQVNENDHLMIMTSSGKIMRSTVQEIGVIGRLTQGVRLIALDEGETVTSLCKVMSFEGEDISEA